MTVSTTSDQNVFSALVANILIVGIFAGAAFINQFDPDLYYLSVQEDEYLEWSTFWAFLLAGIVNLLIVRRQTLARQIPWFAIGIAVLCFVIAMEEISWGQRIIGYRPPRYFLENNFQQELNVHNVVATGYRKFALHAIIIGFGVLLPLATLAAPTRNIMERTGLIAASPALIPAFLATSIFYAWYPWTHSGEWVELMLGLGFLFSGLWRTAAYSEKSGLSARLVTAGLLVLLLGFASSAASRQQRSNHVENIDAANIELAALRNDFLAGKMRVRCDVHKRLFTYTRKYSQDHLLDGEFAKLTSAGLPDARAAFLLDPWNSPYWIRDNCAEDGRKRVVFVYSFGPNRRRESTRWKIIGDDVGEFIFRPQPAD